VRRFGLTGEHPVWVDEALIATERRRALTVERQEWGPFYSDRRLPDRRRPPPPVPTRPGGSTEHHDGFASWNLRRRIETKNVRAVNRQVEGVSNCATRSARAGPAPHHEPQLRFAAEPGVMRSSSACARRSRSEQGEPEYELVLRTGDRREKAIPLAEIVRAFPANDLSLSLPR
jgi:hypothetical protein